MPPRFTSRQDAWENAWENGDRLSFSRLAAAFGGPPGKRGPGKRGQVILFRAYGLVWRGAGRGSVALQGAEKVSAALQRAKVGAGFLELDSELKHRRESLEASEDHLDLELGGLEQAVPGLPAGARRGEGASGVVPAALLLC